MISMVVTLLFYCKIMPISDKKCCFNISMELRYQKYKNDKRKHGSYFPDTYYERKISFTCIKYVVFVDLEAKVNWFKLETMW